MLTYLQLDHKINILNNRYGFITSKNLIEFNKLQIPNEQRIRDDDKVKDIIDYQLNHKKVNGSFNFLGIMNIHHYNNDENDEYYLVDGQHRYEAIKQLYNIHGYNDILVQLEIINVNTRDKLKENYKLINKNTSLPEFPETINKNIPEETALYFKKLYPNIWSKNARARRPNICFNYFQEALGFLTEQLGNKVETSQQLIDIVKEHNENMKYWDLHNIIKNENIITKCQAQDFYLGIYNHVLDDWGYTWVKDIISSKTGKHIKGKTKGKKKIPKKLKDQIWKQNIGYKKGEVLCCCCLSRKINPNDFHAGHIEAEANGGKTEIDNLKAICGPCNIDMQTRHMRKYIEEKYPKNIPFYDNNQYLTEEEYDAIKKEEIESEISKTKLKLYPGQIFMNFINPKNSVKGKSKKLVIKN